MKIQLNNIYLKLVLFSLILLPSFRIADGFPVLRMDDILLLAYPLFYLFIFKGNIPKYAAWRLTFLIFIVFILPFSILNGYLNGYEVSLGDFNQIVRVVKYVSIYLMSFFVFITCSEDEVYKIFRFINICGLFLFIIALSQYFNFFNMNEMYVREIAPTQYETLVNNYPKPRPVGMIGNPNELGFMFVILSILSIFCLIYFKRFWFFISSIILFFGIILTLSRGALLGLAFGLAAFVIIYFFQRGLVLRMKILAVSFSMVLSIIFILMIPQVYDNYTWRFVAVFDIENDASFNARLDNWSENISIIESHPILGVGPLSRADFEHAADNEWLLIWRRYGIVGLFVIIMIFISSIFRRMTVSVRAMYVAMILASFVYMIPAAMFHSLAIFPLFLSIMAFVDVGRGVKQINPTI